ncbi:MULTISPECIES: ROK family protein [Klebsiella]|uniref:ROK family protein n=1 Tax=Klebsiella TaxID=570 RepID=UPI000C79AE7F|nr:ROK family protein [Klebsiella quasipneumoniae]MBC4925451.1 ROK family protein [Klebsiella quasipneumoniae]MBY5243551.1 ROK family protein [Klebsiella quasipneumoniae]MCR8552233.1 ROK family protein [Klebsiella quasipneumoniae]MCW9398085.1 ROK family protein [Klebsiella quasipneumoniae]MDE1584345.1 ROK family protein [Klebsiella quasipneumoniae]
MLHLGIDIGGTKMEAVLLDPAGECVQRLRRPTHKESYDAFMRQLLTLIADIRAVSPQPFTLGIGLPGAIDPQSGRIKNCNCLVLNGHDLRRDIMQQLGQPVWMANDADCFTLSEAVDGAGAGEWGHNPLPGYTSERDGPPQPCYCGKTNCIESFLSGTGFARRYGEQARAEAIVAAAQNGDPRALAHWRHFIDAFARSLASVINILDPQVIVLGGGLSNVSQIYRDLPAAIVPWIFSDSCRTQIKPARFGDASGVRGAAWLPRLPGAVDGPR